MTTWTPEQIRENNAKVARDAQAARSNPRPVLKLNEDRVKPNPELMRSIDLLLERPETIRNDDSRAKEAAVAVLEPKSSKDTHEDHFDPEISNPEQCKRKATLAGSGERETQSPRCPHVRFTLCRVRLLDVDAKFHSCKDLIDGLAICGIICGDKEGQITLEVNQARVAHFKEEKTVIEIEYPDEKTIAK